MVQLNDPQALAEAIRVGLRGHADPTYVAGTVAARSPGKPVLGVRIPALRGAVRAGLRAAVPRGSAGNPDLIRGAADRLWHGEVHEEELAAAMLLRLSDVPPIAETVGSWAPALDNWLSVDELGGAVGAAVHAGHLAVQELLFLARAPSPWQRRLFLVSLITPIRGGADPAGVPLLAEVLHDANKPVRKAATWLITSVLKERPEAAAHFRLVLPGAEPKPLVRLLGLAAA